MTNAGQENAPRTQPTTNHTDSNAGGSFPSSLASLGAHARSEPVRPRAPHKTKTSRAKPPHAATAGTPETDAHDTRQPPHPTQTNEKPHAHQPPSLFTLLRKLSTRAQPPGFLDTSYMYTYAPTRRTRKGLIIIISVDFIIDICT